MPDLRQPVALSDPLVSVGWSQSVLCQMMADRKKAVQHLSSVCRYAEAIDVPFWQHCGTSDVPSGLHAAVEAARDELHAALVDMEGIQNGADVVHPDTVVGASLGNEAVESVD